MSRSTVRGLALFLGLISLVSACESSISTSLDDAACNARLQCADGYVCDMVSLLCVRPGMQSTVCADGETPCAGRCVHQDADALNCGGCGAECTTPDHGTGVCVGSKCNFACTDEGYTACGNVCVALGTDAGKLRSVRGSLPSGRWRGELRRRQMCAELPRAARALPRPVRRYAE